MKVETLYEVNDGEYVSKDVEWRDVVGYEGLYEVSNTGVVKSLGRVVFEKRW